MTDPQVVPLLFVGYEVGGFPYSVVIEEEPEWSGDHGICHGDEF